MRVLIENTIYHAIKIEQSDCSPILYITVPLLSPDKHRIYTVKFCNNYYMTDAFYKLLNNGCFNTDHYSVEEITFRCV